MYRFTTQTWLPASREACFTFFQAAENLEVITPPWLHFRILTPLPIDICEGAHIDYRIRLFGVPMKWRTRISRWRPPDTFVDEQVLGPYRQWIHTHTFESRDGGTLMTDTVDYALYGGAFGAIPHRLFVRRWVKQIFAFRKKTIEQIFAKTDEKR